MADPARRTRLLTAGVLAVLTTVLVLGTARPAAANAFLVAANPAEGTVLTSAPHEVMLTFSEPVEPAADGFAVFGPDGARVDPGVLRRPGPAVVAVRLPGVQAETRRGTYTVRWRVISADSHPVGGTFTFSIHSRSSPAGAPDSGTGGVVGAAYGIAGFVALAGLLALVGAVALSLYGGPRPGALPGVRRLVVTGWAALVAGTLAALVLRGPYVAGTGLGRVIDGGLLGQTLHTRYGAWLALRILLLGLVPALLVWTARRRDSYIAAGLATAVGVALAWTVVAPAAAGILPVTAGVAHVLAAAVWLGGLAAVMTTLRSTPPPVVQPPPAAPLPQRDLALRVDTKCKITTEGVQTESVAMVRRFTRVTAICVAVVVLSGGYQAWRDIGGPAELVTTAYGRLLLIKVVIVGALVALAVRVRPRSTRPGRTVAAGSAAAVAVLALTVALVEVPPAAQAQAARPATLTTESGGTGALTMRLPSTVRGVDSADLTMRAGSPVQAAWTQADIGVGPLPVRFAPAGPGSYRLDWPPLPVDGVWTLAITIRTPGQQQTTARLQVRIR